MSEIFQRGERVPIATWPASSWAYTTTPVPPGTGANDKWFTFVGAKPLSWALKEDIWLHGYWKYDWADYYSKVVQIRPTSFIIDRNPYTQILANAPYKAHNVLEMITPGTYVLDRTNNLVYAWLPDTNGVTVSSFAGDLVTMTNVNNFHWCDIEFREVRGSGMVMTDCTNTVVAGCRFSSLGNMGMVIGDAIYLVGEGYQIDPAHNYRGGSNIVITGTIFQDCNEGGIAIAGGERVNLTRADHQIRNCSFKSYSSGIWTYRPAVRIDGVGITLLSATVSDAPHQAIWFSGNDHVIGYCKLWNICTNTADAGAIYAVTKDWKQRGTVIHNCWIENIACNAIYLDDATSGTTVCSNIIVNSLRPILYGGGRNNLFFNNLAIGTGGTAWYFDNRYIRGPYSNKLPALITNVEAVAYRSGAYAARYPEMAQLETDIKNFTNNPTAASFTQLCVSKGCTASTNIFLSCTPAINGYDTNRLAQLLNWYLTTNYNGFASTNPLGNKEYTLRSDAAELLAGFKQIIQTNIGLYRYSDLWLRPPKDIKIAYP
jgi:hypothetical protein